MQLNSLNQTSFTCCRLIERLKVSHEDIHDAIPGILLFYVNHDLNVIHYRLRRLGLV